MQTAIEDDGLGNMACPTCLTQLRDQNGSLVCPEHGEIIPRLEGIAMPTEFDGPDIHRM